MNTPKEESKCKGCKKFGIREGCYSCSPSNISEESWEEEFDRLFVEDNTRIPEYWKSFTDHHVVDIKNFIKKYLDSHKSEKQKSFNEGRESMAEEIKEICNRCKTEKGLSRAIGNLLNKK